MRAEIFDYVHRCDLGQRAKPAQNARVETLFTDFMGPLTRSKRGNIASLVVLAGGQRGGMWS
jgi:hypothetical protein